MRDKARLCTRHAGSVYRWRKYIASSGDHHIEFLFLARNLLRVSVVFVEMKFVYITFEASLVFQSVTHLVIKADTVAGNVLKP